MMTRPAFRKRLYALAAVAAMAAGAVGLVGSGVASGRSGPPAPRSDRDIPNLGLVALRIQAYYGDPAGTGVASPQSNYARQTDGITARTRRYLRARLSHPGHGGKPALVLDIDDTSLLTYGYEVSQSFGFTVASDDAYLASHTLPAVFGMPALADWAASHGITVFWITGRPDSQRALTRKNLAAWYAPPANKAHLFLRPSSPPAYLTCGTSCTTIQYKSLTREHITGEGFDILANMGDQFSDLKGGFADRAVKMPNPMYFIP